MARVHLVVTNANLLTLAEGQPDALFGWMSIDDDGKILAIGENDPPEASTVLDVNGAFVAPGFISSHSHLFTSGSRGLSPEDSLYGWIQGMTYYTKATTAQDIYWCTLHGSLDFINYGITTAYDFTSSRLSFHASSSAKGSYGGTLKPQDFSDAQFLAKRDSGMRFFHSVPLDDSVGDAEEVLKRVANAVELFDRYREEPTVLGVAISGGVQWAESEKTAALELEAMRTFNIINQPHFLETPHGIAGQQERFSWYRDVGALSPSLIFGHFIHTTKEMVQEAAQHGCSMSWQPTSNARLASGIADIPGYLEAGLKVGMGLDDQSCTDLSDPWQNMRMGLYMLRAQRLDASVLGVREVLRLHTMGSAEILGIDHLVGSLSPGKFADFVVVDPSSPDIGPIWNPIASYVLACGPRNLTQVWIGGKLVSSRGSSTNTKLQDQASFELHTRLGAIAQTLKKDET